MHPRALLEFRSILLQYNAPHAELTYRSELVSIKTHACRKYDISPVCRSPFSSRD